LGTDLAKEGAGVLRKALAMAQLLEKRDVPMKREKGFM